MYRRQLHMPTLGLPYTHQEVIGRPCQEKRRGAVWTTHNKPQVGVDRSFTSPTTPHLEPHLET